MQLAGRAPTFEDIEGYGGVLQRCLADLAACDYEIAQSFCEECKLKAYEAHLQLLDELRHHEEMYHRMSFRRLCEDVATKLPRELRDMIYLNILEGHVDGESIPVSTSVLPAKTSIDHLSCRHTFFPPLAVKMALPVHMWHCWQRSYVGPTILTELTETCYSIKALNFWSSNLHLLPTFLGCSMLSDGSASIKTKDDSISPFQLVRYLYISLKADEMDGHDALDALRSLAYLKPGSRIEISLFGSWRVNFREHRMWFENAIEPLFAVLWGLRDYGHLLSVRVGHYGPLLQESEVLSPKTWLELL